MEPQAPESPAAEQEALVAALQALFAPLAALIVARGLPYAAAEDALKRAVVQAAAQLHTDVLPHRSVSRISTSTGINRREVKRLMTPAASVARPPPRSLASEVFTRWVSDRALRDRKGVPRVLPRTGPAPSFEALAHSVTRDVHPRSLLDELVRLNLAVLDEGADTVALRREGFVPSGDRVRMLGYLASNGGDHLNAVVGNLLGEGQSHFDQAIFADGLSAKSMDAVRELVSAQWRHLLAAVVPPLEVLIEADADLPLHDRRRVRIGLYGFDDWTAEAREARRSRPRAQAPELSKPSRRRKSTPGEAT